MADAGIVRNRAKIEAAIANARAALRRRPDRAAVVVRARRPSAPALGGADDPAVDAGVEGDGQGAQEARLPFVGPTTAYALMQACGLVDDHIAGCSWSLTGVFERLEPAGGPVSAADALPPRISPRWRATSGRTCS